MQHAEALGGFSEQSQGLLHALTTSAEELGSAAAALRAIDPPALSRDITEIRRDVADSAVETRDVRRHLAELQEALTTLSASHESLTKEHTRTLGQMTLLIRLTILITILSAAGILTAILT